jgi:hypothetical protein
MNDQQSSRMDQILNLLAEEIEERVRARGQPAPSDAPRVPIERVEVPPRGEAEEPLPPAEPSVVEAPASPAVPPAEPVEPVEALAEPWAEEEGLPPELEPEPELPPAVPGPPHAARLMGRLALGLLVAIVLVNVPLNRHGTTLATAMPDSASLMVRDGLVVKERDDEEIYIYQDGKFRWISSLDAFEHFGLTWGDVHIVEDGYLERFEIGTPLHVLLKCRGSPHIYRLEGGEKRWIRDIMTFEAEGHVWEDVRFVSCEYLRDLPDGETIPPGSGPPPQP